MDFVQYVHKNTFLFDDFTESCFLDFMTPIKTRSCWRKDLSEFRNLSDRERAGFLLVLEWFENFRLRNELEAGRAAAKAFWRNEVLREDRPRETWQLEQWSDAIQWYLKWSRKRLRLTRWTRRGALLHAI